MSNGQQRNGKIYSDGEAMKYSILVPTFNRENFLGRCLRSLISQDIPETQFEIVVIDDASRDNSADVLKGFEGRIVLIKNETNYGLATSLNLGLKVARGEYIVRVDSDDFVSRSFLGLLGWHAEEYASDAVACDYWLVDENERRVKLQSAFHNPIGCGIMFRADALKQVGGYREGLRIHEDRELMSRFRARFEIDHLALPLYRYRKHENSLTGSDGLQLAN